MTINHLEKVTLGGSRANKVRSVAERIDTNTLSYEAARLVELERQIPVDIEIDRAIRAKILDKCGMTCTFCHNEGTPVAAAFSGEIGLPNPSYSGGRVSVFSETNGAHFLPGIMRPDAHFTQALLGMSWAIGSSELHLTGGEPTLHPDIANIIASAKQLGYSVKMTSNGENGKRVLSGCKAAGLDTKAIIDAWLVDEATTGIATPDIFVQTYAPLATIRNRITKRQQAGQKEEKYWGFNSPFYLDIYQNRWDDVIAELSRRGFACLRFDTTAMDPDEMNQSYASLRTDVLSRLE